MFAGIRSTPSRLLKIAKPGEISLSSTTRSITLAREKSRSSGFVKPNESVRLPCGSASINNTFLPFRTSPVPKLTAVVVLPTPPFLISDGNHFAFVQIKFPPLSKIMKQSLCKIGKVKTGKNKKSVNHKITFKNIFFEIAVQKSDALEMIFSVNLKCKSKLADG